LLRLGVLEEKILVTGNMKFDVSLPAANRLVPLEEIKNTLGLDASGKLLIAASTHPGEEKIVLDIYKALLREISGLKLLIAPRHPQRSKEVASQAMQARFEPVFLSKIAIDVTKDSGAQVFILDLIGQLNNFFQAADVVFMGGSLVKKGGHNLLEPAALGKPVIFGPQMFNFRDISVLFLNNQAAIMVHSQDELKEQIKYLFAHPDKARQMAEISRKLILENTGATERNRQVIRNLLS